MKRRKFLSTGSAAAAGIPIALQGLSLNAYGAGAFSEEDYTPLVENDHILVIIQCFGGNDGLNTVIPIDQYSKYYNVRPNIAIRESKILTLPDHIGTGLHPAMSGMHNMYKEGHLSIVQNVGYPDQSMSHFHDTDIWQSAGNRYEAIKDGWLGRFLYEEYPGYPVNYPNSLMKDPLAIEFGSSATLSLLSKGFHMGYTISNPESIINDKAAGDSILPDTPYGDQVRYLRQISTQANKYSASIKTAYSTGKNFIDYPPTLMFNNGLSDNLKVVAKLIHGGLQTKIYTIKIGGFDTHVDQAEGPDNTNGIHAGLLKDLSGAIKAFHDDLKASGNDRKVIGMTVSEFGRRIKSNAGKGTDHGAAAPLFVFGTQVTPGVLGDNPTIPDIPSVWDVVPFQHDFRSVYMSILKRWLCQGSSSIRNILFRDFNELNIVSDGECTPTPANSWTNTISNQYGSEEELVGVYPNPVFNSTNIECTVTKPGHVIIQLISNEGTVIKKIYENRNEPAGSINLNVNLSQFKLGRYYIKFQSGSNTQLKLILKVN